MGSVEPNIMTRTKSQLPEVQALTTTSCNSEVHCSLISEVSKFCDFHSEVGGAENNKFELWSFSEELTNDLFVY